MIDFYANKPIIKDVTGSSVFYLPTYTRFLRTADPVTRLGKRKGRVYVFWSIYAKV
jgi:hypothetical protein